MNTPQNLTLEATLASQEKARSDKAELWLSRLTWTGRILLLAILVIAPWQYGGIDPWSQRIIALCIGTCLAIWWFETSLRSNRSLILPYVMVPVAIGILLGLLQLWELPQWLSGLMGRQSELYQQLGADLKLSPTISLSHEGTKYFISRLTLALAALLLGCRYFRTRLEVTLLLAVMTVNGAVISVFGIIQKLTSQEGTIFWNVELINGGIPFGPYVNRNNCAGFLLICLACSIGLIVLLMSNKAERGPRQIMSKSIPFWRQFAFHLALFISELDTKKTLSIIGAVLISIGIFASLSRGGVMAMLIGLTITLLLYGMARKPSFTGFIFLPVVLLALGIAVWAGLGNRLLERFETASFEPTTTGSRFAHWAETWPAIGEMGWLGAGIGSYNDVHRIYRNTAETKVFVFAESQFYQTLVEMGWLGLTLLVATWGFAYYYAAFALWRGRSPVTIALGTAGVLCAISGAVAAFADFGLYQSANTIAMAVFVGAVAYNAQSLAGRLKESTWLKYEASSRLCQTIALIMFTAVFLAGLGINNRANIDSKREVSPRKFSRTNPDLETTERLISALTPLVRRYPISRGLNYLSRLYVHRMRLQHFDQAKQQLASSTEGMSEEKLVEVDENMWNLSSLESVHEHYHALKSEASVLEARSYQQAPIIQENLQRAAKALNLSRRSSLLQPKVQIQLAKIYAAIGAGRKASKHAEIAAKLAPGSLSIHQSAALHFLQTGNREKAGVYIKKYLELKPINFPFVAALISGKTSRKFPLPTEDEIVDGFLPDNPQVLYQYATQYMSPDALPRQTALRRADVLLKDVSLADQENMVLSANVKLALGQTKEATQRFTDALVSYPYNFPVQAQLVELLNDQGKFNESIRRLEDLAERDYLNRKKYLKLLQKTRKLSELD